MAKVHKLKTLLEITNSNTYQLVIYYVKNKIKEDNWLILLIHSLNKGNCYHRNLLSNLLKKDCLHTVIEDIYLMDSHATLKIGKNYKNNLKMLLL